MEQVKGTEVILMDSQIYHEIIRKLELIESHVIRSAEFFKYVDQELLQMTTREVMETLKISESTLYRWRDRGLITYQYNERGHVLISYNQLYRAIYTGAIRVHQIEKKDSLAALTSYKDDIIRRSISGKL